MLSLPFKFSSLPDTPAYITDLALIAARGEAQEEENDHFLRFVQPIDDMRLDALAHRLNDNISAAIDCTACGNCCSTLVINVADDEVAPLAEYLQLSEADTKEKYIEESMAGRLFINTVPCAFLSGTICSIYAARFTECREFPHLHKPGFKGRLLGTLLHYGRCPIIYNVIGEMKQQLGFYE